MRTYNRGYTGYIGSEQERAIGRVDVLLRVAGQITYSQLCMAVNQLDSCDRVELLHSIRQRMLTAERTGTGLASAMHARRLEDALKSVGAPT